MNSYDSSHAPEAGTRSGSSAPSGITCRKYAAGLRELGDREWSVALGDPPNRWFVPLGTTDTTAAARAAQLASRDLAARGWDRLSTLLPREFTMAISWLETPMAWTYVTLFTLPRAATVAEVDPAANRLRLVLIEPDPVFRAALVHWLGRIAGVTCVGWANEQPWLSQPRRHPEFDIILVNRYVPAFVADRFRVGRGPTGTDPLVFGYGIYPTSDDIFASVSGVEAGYFLRRRSLNSVLEPLSAAFAENQLVRSEVPRTLRRYFQNLLTLETETATAGGLTTRERQILACIQRGLRDKEIATSLGISPLTVHTHLKHAFHKLGAHTRTEAVVKFLEK